MDQKPPTDTTYIMVRDRKALMQHRDNKPGVRYPGTVGFPGGQIKPGELPVLAIIRSINEKFGLKIAPEQCEHLTTYFHDGTDVDYVVIVRLHPDQEPALKEGQGMHWMTLDEIKQRELPFGQEAIIGPLEEQF